MNWYRHAQVDWNTPNLVEKGSGSPSSPQEVTNTIKKLISTFGVPVCDINKGECETFSHELYSKLSGANIYEIWHESDYPAHFFIEVNDLYYDAEVPEGVPDWKMLPIYKGFFAAK